MSNTRRKRANPFRSRDHTNFPPLDEFFDQDQSEINTSGYDGGSSPTRTDAGNTSAISYNELNFSVDMSIGGKAEMAQHRYLVQKYGIDGIRHQKRGEYDGDSSPNNSRERGGSPRLTAEGYDWDRIMDDSSTNISFSSTAVDAAPKLNNNNAVAGYLTPPDQSCDYDDAGSYTGSSFFDKSFISSLKTPEKMRFKTGDESGRKSKVTLSRGQVHDSSDSMSSIEDAERSTNVSATGSGFERMFHAALRFNEDFDEQPSFVNEELSLSIDRVSNKEEKSREKNSSVSFAADTSFATSESRYPQNNHRRQENSFEKGLTEYILSDTSPIVKQNDESFGVDWFKEFSSLSESPVRQKDNEQSFDSNPRFVGPQKSERGEISSLESPALSTPTLTLNGRHAPELLSEAQEKTEQNKSNFLLLGLSPIDLHAAERNLKSPTPMPFGENRAMSASQFESPSVYEKYSRGIRKEDIHSSLSDEGDADDECTKKHLFRDEDENFYELPALSLEIHNDSIEMIQTMLSEQCHADQSRKSNESFFEGAPATPNLSEELNPLHRRKFGSNAASRINSNVANSGKPDRGGGASDNEINDSIMREENRRGVRLSRSSKLRELGLENAMLLSQQSHSGEYGDSSF